MQLSLSLQIKPWVIRLVEGDHLGSESGALSQVGLNLRQEIKTELIEKGFDPSQISLSVAHSWAETRYAVVSIGAGAGGCEQIGVDLEYRERKVHPRVLPRLLSLAERGFGLSVLEAWTIKEALFKANPLNKGTVLSQYLILKVDLQNKTGTAEFRGVLFDFQWHACYSFWIAIAHPRFSDRVRS